MFSEKDFERLWFLYKTVGGYENLVSLIEKYDYKI